MKVSTLTKTLICLAGLLSQLVLAKDRYKDFEFAPDYSDVSGNEPMPEWLRPQIPDWQRYNPVSYLPIGENEFIFYMADTPRDGGNVKKYLKALEEFKTSGSKGFFDTRWDAVVANIAGKPMFLKGKEFELRSQGHGGVDYYGCIEEKPLYSSRLIEGELPAVWVITGKGNVQAKIFDDFIKIAAFNSKTGNLYFEQFLEKMNYYYKSTKYKGIDYLLGVGYKEGDPLENLRGRKQYAKMFIKDFDHDDQLDVIFWHRQYFSTLVADKERTGFIFEKEWFDYYVEKDGGFIKTPLTNEQGNQILKKAQLTWRDGYPKDNHLCELYDKNRITAPMMMKVIDPGIAY